MNWQNLPSIYVREGFIEGQKMAYNTMSITRQTPYIINNNGAAIKKKADEESAQSSRSSQQENEQPQIDQNNNRKSIQEQWAESKESNRLAVASYENNIKNSTVNIAQILKDFRSTAKAIGASPELTEEVEAYLSLVEKQVQKENPDTKIVRSNLKNASILLDNYITETLQRPSKVVENWIDALFLQRINYKFNDEDVNPNFLVRFPKQKNGDDSESSDDENQSEEEEENQNESSNELTKKSFSVPQDEKLKNLFLKAKKYTYANNTKKAMELFNEALARAVEISDHETESKILYEIGKIYDKNDYLAQALTSYNKSLCTTKDLGVKAKAHYSMAQIYDDVAQFEPAINHYMSSISYAGENENLVAQSTSLTKIGNIFCDKYNKNAFDFLLVAENIANEAKDSKSKGYVASNIANAYNKFNEPQNALKYYSNAIKDYQDAKSPLKVAINYKNAAELMQDFNNPRKAKSLFKKALIKARQTDDIQLMKEIHDALCEI